MKEGRQQPRGLLIPKRVLLWTFGLIALLSCAALPQYVRAKWSERWPTTPGVVTASYMRSEYFKHVKVYRAQVEFHYHVENTEYSRATVWLGRDHWAAEEAWQPTLNRYPVGKAVIVYYDPKHPEKGILEPGRFGEMELLYKLDLIYIGVFSFALLATLLWYHDRRDV